MNRIVVWHGPSYLFPRVARPALTADTSQIGHSCACCSGVRISRHLRQEPETAAFRAAFRERAKQVHSERTVGAAKRRRTGEASRRLPDGVILQKQAAALAPTGTMIWRDRTRQGWCAHPPEHPRISALWSTCGGEQAALRALLRQCWTIHLEGEGAGPEDCPIEGLFGSVAAPGASSSSSGGDAVARLAQ